MSENIPKLPKSTNHEYYQQIDSFRFFAVLLVLISHWLSNYTIVKSLHFGSLGVDTFFIISGFLISNQLYLYKEGIDLKLKTFKHSIYIFFIRRSLRISPLYFTILLLATFLNKGLIREAFVWNMTYTSNYYILQLTRWPGNFSHLWSLSVEEHFYLIWPFVVLLLKRKILPTVIISIASYSFYFRYTHSLDYLNCHINTISNLELFMAGALLAYVYRYFPTLFSLIFHSTFLRNCSLFLFTIMLVIIYFNHRDVEFFTIYLKTMLGCIFIFNLGFLITGYKGILQKILENRFLIHLGKLSYCIYLIHNFIPGILLPIYNSELHDFLKFGIYLITTLVGSELIYRFFENPIRKLNRKFVY